MFPVGHVLDGTYRIERLLGKGGMAYVYVVSHVRLPRRFALKVITAPIAQETEYVLRFRREAEILAELEHPNLVTVNDWNTTADGKPYLVMELLSGEDLAQCLHRTGALPPKVALSIFAQAAEALQVAHGRNIVHRDLKPANIFLCKNGVVPYFAKVLDFGIAKSAHHAGGPVTENLALMGTPAYMAPEQAQGNIAKIDARTDQFALALVLYEMLTGRAAFYRRGETPILTLYRVISEDPEPLADERLNRVIMRALSKDPADRYLSLAEFVNAVIDCAPEPLELPERTDRNAATADEAPPRPLNQPRLPSLDKAVQSSITEPRAEMLPIKTAKPSRHRGIWLGGGVLSVLGLSLVVWLPPNHRNQPGQRLADLARTIVVDSGADALAAANRQEPGPLSNHPPKDSLEPERTSDAGSTEPPADKTTHSKVGKASDGKTSSGRGQPAAHLEPVLVGVDAKTAVGKFILRCVASSLGSTARRSAPIQLRRTDRLKVVSHLPPERSLQLEECLSNLTAGDVPKSVDVRFAAK